ncbi:unnamed protein product [Orchesella dallaii]|uniref:Peroxisomal membrane protein PEX16 n=1 Tax=Orchesella dallaii TaxID=48710 RepID=A0ABP1PMV4_9HEXA
MQSIKAGLRAALLFYYKVGLIRSPAIPSSERSKYLPHRIPAEPDVVFVLKHSGRVIRKLHASPPMHSRDWNVPEIPLSQFAERNLPRDKLLVEMIHISCPICHLVSLGACGTSSWKPWLLSLAMDVGSLYLHGDPLAANKSEQMEPQNRTFALLLYPLRSPFYDRSTKLRLISSLESVGNRIPKIGNLFLLLAQAIPQWQSTYSYVWNDF